MSTNQYQEMRNRQQAEINAFPMFFAFNKTQFAEGMRTLGLSLSDTCQMCSIFGGGYCRKSDAANWMKCLPDIAKSWKMPFPRIKRGKALYSICSYRNWRITSIVTPAMCRKHWMLLVLRPSIWRLCRSCGQASLWPAIRLCSTTVLADFQYLLWMVYDLIRDLNQ